MNIQHIAAIIFLILHIIPIAVNIIKHGQERKSNIYQAWFAAIINIIITSLTGLFYPMTVPGFIILFLYIIAFVGLIVEPKKYIQPTKYDAIESLLLNSFVLGMCYWAGIFDFIF